MSVRADGWQPTDLVQESYVRLLDWRGVGWENRAHFLATTARMSGRYWWTPHVRDGPSNVAAAWTPRRSRAWTSRRQGSWTSSRSKMR